MRYDSKSNIIQNTNVDYIDEIMICISSFIFSYSKRAYLWETGNEGRLGLGEDAQCIYK